MTVKLSIINYKIDNSTIESTFLFRLTKDNLSKDYELKIPLNPLIDIEILKLYDLDFNSKIIRLQKIIKKQEYSNETIICIKNFIEWINLCLANNDDIHI